MARLTLSPTKLWDAWKEVAATAETAAALVLAGDRELVERARAVLAPDGGWIPTQAGGLAALAG
ncbi:MAG: hypothetical protein M1325_04120, partial [Actinobacteria bacterium]|nr:hypothetical protein [Actinomycetota bacterium]